MQNRVAGRDHDLVERFKAAAGRLRRELHVYRLVIRHPRTPRLSKILLGAAVGYAVLPFDLIPDFLPVVGHLDDLVVLPALVAWAIWLLPEGLLDECRERVAGAAAAPRPPDSRGQRDGAPPDATGEAGAGRTRQKTTEP